ncbi:MAG TPA: DUF2322 family protein [Gammaproteobacteria bacterium]|nr:DUF2322 family protein [Gammaproteobacteria bacterium]
MTRFADNLKTLPSIESLERLELYGEGYEPDVVIRNKPGEQGALAVYYKVAVDFGGIGPQAARRALELFAEHVEDARAHPGKHPNIDRLFTVIERDDYYSVKAIPKNA